MSIFNLYFEIGLKHITDLVGYDHILFLVTLCAVYSILQWRQLLILITAFTIGHSITLALAIMNIILIPSKIIEFLIPLTILITSVTNIFQKGTTVSAKIHKLKYITAMFFGLIHGLGFSNFLRGVLSSEENLFKPLLAFNLGLEAGQLAIITCFVILLVIFNKILKVNEREWNLFFSGAGFGISTVLMFERYPF
ncbi:MAG: HupE / UreJ protein [Bacteroidetes bacterium GWA2_31_9]|nr:MAG: HupE / UreJ protein [Bacteroidetes bacterium GWA2_31_9]